MNAHDLRMAIGRRFAARIVEGDAVFLTGAGGAVGLPCTVSDGEMRQFGGANSLVLLQVMKDRSWIDPRFFTASQITQSGWSIAPDAKQISLQFLVSTGDDGLPLEAPFERRFHVFNANEIVGAPMNDIVLPPSRRSEFELAASRAGMGDGDVAIVLDRWLSAMQVDHVDDVGAIGVALRTKLASTLLTVQLGLPERIAGETDFASDMALEINRNPISFFQAVNDAQSLAALVLGQVDLVRVERRALEGVTRSQGEKPHEAGDRAPMGIIRADQSGRVEAMFAERAAVLAVPFADKDQAKALGAVWYGPQSVWFVPKGVDVATFKKWAPSEHCLAQTVSEDVLIESFREAMRSVGLDTSGEIELDGLWHNVAIDGYKGGKNKSGSYIVSLTGGRYGQPIGTVINKFSGQSFTWTHKGGVLTPEQRARTRSEAVAREAAAALEVQKGHDLAAGHAGEIWAVGGSAQGHGYVQKKGIAADCFRQVSGAVLLRYPEFKAESGQSIIREQEDYLIVPMTNAAGELRAIQAIDATGSVKLFMRGGQKKGTMLVLGADSFDSLASMVDLSMVAYAEGVSTGASLREAAGTPVVVCFDAGNLETVFAQTAAKLSADVLPVLAVDNDQFHVERALGFLSDKLGVNPHAPGGGVVSVEKGAKTVRSVALGEAVADGEWHQAARGRYCMTLRGMGDMFSVEIEIAPNDGGRRMSAKFGNRGIEAGTTAMGLLEKRKPGLQAVMAIPEFKSLVDRPTDWNDLAQREGIEAVRTVLREQGISLPGPAQVVRGIHATGVHLESGFCR